MSLIGEKNFKMKMRDVETAFKYRRFPYPKRSVELIALLAISCTFFLFMHTNKLNSRLKEMEMKLQPSEFSALGLTGNNHLDGPKHDDINTLHGTYQYLKSTGQLHDLTTEKLNNTPNAEVDLIFFNRVPKVGSQTMMELLKMLGKRNGFHPVRDKPGNTETIMLADDFEQNLVEEILEAKRPGTYSKHVAYIDFEDLDYPEPIYINLVRNPVERIISWFYYIRAPWYIAERKKMFPNLYQLPSAQWLKKDFSECVLKGDPECTFLANERKGLGDHRRQMLFFCGQDSETCMPFDNYEAMQRAKHHVETKYAVVGSWEDTNVTLTVLENYIPRYFSGAAHEYYKAENRLHKTNRNSFRPPVTDEARRVLSRNLTHEIEFYHFCKQRLYKQYIAVYLDHNAKSAQPLDIF
ncbi:heparan sulfate 2-O-sulfotransferase pipe-like isoform X1 [Stomoxys calcitrans]|uniref:heparan sulfate 2-O-sulfotransferase pipe-like isoform X1 n=2 Tax=Stomoxys calcitrans TaxID=35570 RepID=UPI0027E217F8|nr:heparan sulfate 2-O-sulfotransferase pipe-like isoform X1 [Stomoxys calcitrans]